MNDSSPTGAARLPDAADETLAERAYRLLRVDIIRGVRPPGERLRIERLKSLYDIGPSPLREALQRLHADRLVVNRSNRGFTVSSLDFDDFADLNIARTAVEIAALRLSMTHGGSEWESRIVAAHYVLAKEDRALSASATRVPDSWEQANAAFHLALVDACGSSWLLRTRADLHDLCERFRRAAVYGRIGERDLHAEHDAIAEAVLARDEERAASLLERHFSATASSLSSLARTKPIAAVD